MENDVNRDDGAWLDLLEIIGDYPEYAFRVLEMADAMTGRVASEFTMSGERIAEDIVRSTFGYEGEIRPTDRGYANEKLDKVRATTLSYFARGRDNSGAQRLVLSWGKTLVANLRKRWVNGGGREGKEWSKWRL